MSQGTTGLDAARQAGDHIAEASRILTEQRTAMSQAFETTRAHMEMQEATIAALRERCAELEDLCQETMQRLGDAETRHAEAADLARRTIEMERSNAQDRINREIADVHAVAEREINAIHAETEAKVLDAEQRAADSDADRFRLQTENEQLTAALGGLLDATAQNSRQVRASNAFVEAWAASLPAKPQLAIEADNVVQLHSQAA